MTIAIDQWAEHMRQIREDSRDFELAVTASMRRDEMISTGMQMYLEANLMPMFAAFNPDIRVLDAALESSERIQDKALDLVFRAMRPIR